MICGLFVLHYGKEYLRYAIEAIYPVVDKIVIVYSPTPSHGHESHLECPESLGELFSEAMAIDVDEKIIWINKTFQNEHVHRDYAYDKCKRLGADVVVVTDADEIWDTNMLKHIISAAKEEGKARYRIMMQHFYRSFDEVCRDPHRQVRILNPKADNNEEIDIHTVKPVIHHFGYAQSEKIIYYKISCHGHKSEFRPQWFEDKFLNYQKGITKDVHPVCHTNFWNPQPFDKEKLPLILHKHPYFNKEVI